MAQPEDVIDRLREIVAAAELCAGEVVLDVGTGVGVLVPLIAGYRPSLIIACDLSERMLARLRQKYAHVRVIQADIVFAPLAAVSVDSIFMNAMYGNIGDEPTACREATRLLRPGGRLVVSHPEAGSLSPGSAPRRISSLSRCPSGKNSSASCLDSVYK